MHLQTKIPMPLDEVTQGRILIVLGYPKDGTLLAKRKLAEDYETPVVQRIQMILQEVNELDCQLKEGLKDSMAASTAHTKLNWSHYFNLMHNQGQLLLEELARLAGVELFKSKYKPNVRWRVHYQ
jgi:hypothetical protein